MKGKLDVVPHLEDLWRYARVLTRNDADADDLVQEALVRALSLAHAYDSSRPLVPWLITIVRNAFLTGETRKQGEARRMDALAAMTEATLLPSQDHSVELAEVTKAFRALPAEQAEVLHLVGVLGFTYADTAAVLAVPTGTVMSRLSRARAALRVAMEGRAGSAPASRLRVVGGRDGSA
ncbi:MAG TPA: sigma-70 family RNA polymerase sigma factor [Mesorhizobium sp.]|jgi:RNA polymerase sigma-70 factor (ECF subfamily)|nr:sigma-70 family RNA polymerase sigma factor [Mesorhizobium sp.]